MAGSDTNSFAALTGLLLEALFPGRCLLCGQWLSLPVDDGIPLCHDCRARTTPLSGKRCARCGMPLVSENCACMRCREAAYSFESNIALFPHVGPAKSLLRGIKFQGRSRLAPFFAAHAADALREAGRMLPIVPVPPRPRRGRPDTVELVARCMERGHGMDVRRLLVRVGGAQQKSLNFEQRRRNLAGRIRLRDPRGDAARGPLPAEVILLDDVFTTGATLDACARVLREGGCARVYGMTLVIEE